VPGAAKKEEPGAAPGRGEAQRSRLVSYTAEFGSARQDNDKTTTTPEALIALESHGYPFHAEGPALRAENRQHPQLHS
jgi:hypothetical protein